jgi:predicted anti-sigma-YlaC factor YlaD
MDCRTVHDHLSAYLDRVLPLQIWERLDTHVRRCARCRREFTQLQTVTAWVRNLPRIEPSPTFRQQVCQLHWYRPQQDGHRSCRAKDPCGALVMSRRC